MDLPRPAEVGVEVGDTVDCEVLDGLGRLLEKKDKILFFILRRVKENVRESWGGRWDSQSLGAGSVASV